MFTCTKLFLVTEAFIHVTCTYAHIQHTHVSGVVFQDVISSASRQWHSLRACGCQEHFSEGKPRGLKWVSCEDRSYYILSCEEICFHITQSVCDGGSCVHQCEQLVHANARRCSHETALACMSMGLLTYMSFVMHAHIQSCRGMPSHKKITDRVSGCAFFGF